MANTNDYILVKDEQGNLKYYKDGKFFDIREVEKNKQPSQPLVKAPQKIVKATQTMGPDKHLIKQEEQDEDLADDQQVREQYTSKVDQTVDDIITELKIAFTDENIEKKFRTALASRVRGVRGDQEFEYLLKVPKDSGGFGLTEDKIKVIIAVVKKHLVPFEKEARGLGVKPLKPKIDKPLVKKEAPKIKNEQKINTKKPLIPIETQLSAEQIIKGAKKPQATRKSVSAKSEQQNIQGVKYKTELVGPIQELQSMSLTDFRRLGQEADERIEEVKEKIEIQRQEDYVKFIEAINAWKESPVCQIYNEMGVQSLMSGKSLEQVIVDRQIQNKESLTKSEFEHILKLNQELEI